MPGLHYLAWCGEFAPHKRRTWGCWVRVSSLDSTSSINPVFCKARANREGKEEAGGACCTARVTHGDMSRRAITSFASGVRQRLEHRPPQHAGPLRDPGGQEILEKEEEEQGGVRPPSEGDRLADLPRVQTRSKL